MWRLLVIATALGACGPRAPVGLRAPASPPVAEVAAAPVAAPADAPLAVPAVVAPAYPSVPSGIVLSRLPTPHRDAARPTPPIDAVDDARRLVGRRDPRPPLVAALAWSAALTQRPAPEVTDAAALVAWAQAAGAWRAVPAIAPGDLIVFDRAVGGARASLIAVALGRDARGVVEVLYLGAGVVRRGWFDVTRPALRRDRAGRVVNTPLRHNRDQPPRGTHFLAGELFAGAISTAPR
ncbi:MAG: hypothetical protein KA201_10935 [Kofleriaceae bacterium]|nr:hypothetical protein [Kofleriaceae bacterium]